MAPLEAALQPEISTTAAGEAVPTVLRYARAYCRRGWRVVPIPAGRKGPCLPGWQKLELKPDDLPQYFARDCNIGVAFGPLSDDLVDVDLDCAEALALADLYLPKTRAQFGRPSKPRSHRLYIARGAAYASFGDPLIAELPKEKDEKPPKDTLLELRADPGHQTIFPPSIADGEHREWHGDRVAPRVINTSQLRRATTWLAIGCLVMRYVGEEPARHPTPVDDGELFPDLPALLWEADPILGRRAYEWLGREPPDWPPPPEAQAAREPGTGSCKFATKRGEVDLGDVVAAIPNNCDWFEWNKFGMAIWVATEGSSDGKAIFHDFSRRSSKYDQKATERLWKGYSRSKPNTAKTGIGKLIKAAIANGWRSPEVKKALAQKGARR